MQLILSLMPGIDLLGMAFQQEGFCVVRGGDPIFGGDVRGEHYPAGKFDGIISGPPCQSFSSLAHLVRANGHEPKFGNLIPEFERCVREARPRWFLMENVRAAPIPVVEGYAVSNFLICNSWIAGGDGYGQEQMRLRRFSFSVLGAESVDLRKWIDFATFLLPDAVGTQTQWTPDNSPEAKGRETAVKSDMRATRDRPKLRGTICGGDDYTPGQRRKTAEVLRERHTAVTACHDDPNVSLSGEAKKARRERNTAVSAMHGAATAYRPGIGGERRKYRFAEALKLQGLPPDFLSDAPFTAQGKLKAVANGVALPTGRAIARAVLKAIEQIRISGMGVS